MPLVCSVLSCLLSTYNISFYLPLLFLLLLRHEPHYNHIEDEDDDDKTHQPNTPAKLRMGSRTDVGESSRSLALPAGWLAGLRFG